jgi:hypothetical protein
MVTMYVTDISGLRQSEEVSDAECFREAKEALQGPWTTKVELVSSVGFLFVVWEVSDV